MVGNDRDSDPPPSHTSNSPPSRPDNPFIKFKNQVDHSISSLLQGVIGLPSAISRNQGETPQWATFDDNLRRRDEPQARQNQSKDSESRKPLGPAASEIHDLPLYSAYFGPISDRYPRFRGRTCMDHLRDSFSLDPRNSTFHSPASLLPYLLHSSYSPLKLTEENCGDRYCEAFEDLIRCTTGRGMGSVIPYGPEFSPDGTKQDTHGFKTFGITWLGHLKIENLLELPSLNMAPRWPYPIFELVEDEGAQTEHDMLDRILSLAEDAIVKAPEKIRAAREAVDRNQARYEGEEGPQTERDMYDRILSLVEEVLIKGPEKTKAVRESVEREHTRRMRETTPKAPIMSPQDLEERGLNFPSIGTSKVVSSSTSSDVTTHGDGSVETSVSVWRLFADGRSTITTTTHVEEPARDEDGKSLQRTQPAEKSREQEEKEDEKKTEKKGWFWN